MQPSSTSAILDWPRSIGMTFRKSIFLPSLPDLVVSMYQRSRDISSTACLLKRWAIWGWQRIHQASRGCSSFCNKSAHDKAHLIRHALQKRHFFPEFHGGLGPPEPYRSLRFPL
ncbi:hypothetical protein MJ563_20445 [Klebsiella pneumoniae]|nr:hypothetical protein MJ563_20445 [Klebsiella pneumoniae]